MGPRPVNHVATLQIDGVRNLATLQIPLHPTGNIFYGLNGAGKTSLLESLHFLSTGRSFRAGNPRLMLRHGADHARVVAQLADRRGTVTLGVQRDRNGALMARLAGDSVGSLSVMAERVPVVLLDNESSQLITGSPEVRRRFLDATVFHVEQPFLRMWRRYQRALKQRNAGLRHGTLGPSDGAWREELATAGQALNAARHRVVAQLQERTRAMMAELSPSVAAVDIQLRPGWDDASPLQRVLADRIDSDARQGHTQVGPHRADLRVSVDGKLAAEVLSRGQLKVLAAALRLAQGDVVQRHGERSPIYLVDDLLAELDAGHAERVCRRLSRSGSQVLLTTIEPGLMLEWWGPRRHVFHVEQGEVALEAGR